MPHTALYRFTCFASQIDPPGPEVAVEMLIHRTPEGITYTVKDCAGAHPPIIESGSRQESALVDRVLRRLGEHFATAGNQRPESAEG